jgi:protein-disulfide isomerase
MQKGHPDDIDPAHGNSDCSDDVSGLAGRGPGASANLLHRSARGNRKHRQRVSAGAPRGDAGRHGGARQASAGGRSREKHRAAVAETKATLFSSPHQVVLGNPQGNVTMVEFFDYNCGFCKRALSDMLDLLKTDPNLKFVLKEFPVLGEGSVEAAHVAVAARMQDVTGKKYIEFHQKLLGGRGPADKARALAVAKEVGFDMARIEKDMNSDEVKKTIDEDMKLADALGVSGTPSYVVGDEVVVGAVGIDALREKIGRAQLAPAQAAFNTFLRPPYRGPRQASPLRVPSL